MFTQTRTFVQKVFSLSTGSETDLEQCIVCSDMICHGHMNDHVKRHKGLSANERKLLHNYYELKEDDWRLRLNWTGHRDEVFTKAVNGTFDVPQKKSHTNETFKKSLLTFRKPQPPKDVQDAMRIFQDIEKNVSPKVVAKKLNDAGYKLEKNMFF